MIIEKKYLEKTISILLKRTKAKGWNRKIGMLLVSRTKVASLKQYEKELEEYCNTDLSIFKLKKKIEQEGDMQVKCIIVYTIDAKSEEMNLKLKDLK